MTGAGDVTIGEPMNERTEFHNRKHDSAGSHCSCTDDDAFYAQNATDTVCYYRNLAITLGAKPEDMVNTWDRKLCEDWPTMGEFEGQTPTERTEAERREWADVWDLVEEVAGSGVEFEDERVGYVTVQIDRDTWQKIREVGA